MRRRFWGRSTWLWGVELAVVACFVVVRVVSDKTSTKIIAVGYVLVRVLFSAIQVSEWRQRQRSTDDARDDGVVPPR